MDVRRRLAAEREKVAWELCLKGWRQTRIAEELEAKGLGKVTRQAVSAMLLRAEEKVLKDLTKNVGGLKARQTEALWFVYEQSVEAWDKSKLPQKQITTTGKPETDPRTGQERQTVKENHVTIREQPGDPRFLEQARQALADIRKLWGLESAPIVNINDNRQINVVQTAMADKGFQEIAAQLTDQLARATGATLAGGNGDGGHAGLEVPPSLGLHEPPPAADRNGF